jgi:excisionase family DNA binding protein
MSILKNLRERTGPLTVAELAKLLRVTQDTVQRWARKQQIPCIRIGDTIRFDGSMLADWIEGASNQPRVGRFLHPCSPADSSEHQVRWEDLAELTPDAVPSPSIK